MAQITRCPSCGTMFKVVADQLKVSAGWVRCGHCAEVFDAQLNLQKDAPAPSRDQAEAGAPAPSANPQIGSDPPPPGQVALTASAIPSTNPSAKMVVGIGNEEFARGLNETEGESASHAQPVRIPDLFRDPQLGMVDRTQPETRSTPRRAPPGPSQVEIEDLAFMRQSRSQAFWRLPLVRAALGLLALLLLGSLGLQLALDQRDRLAALEPAAKPWLQALCIPFNCVVSPWRQLDALAIDGSSFSKMAPNLYRLGFAIKNIGSLDVAVPSIELTLTDAQDQTLARRVMHAAELGFVSASIKSGAEWTGGAVLRSSPRLGEVAGYRILAFYP